MYYLIDEQINSSIEDAKKVLYTVNKEIAKLINNNMLLFEIRIILDELVYNSIKHGNKYDENKKVNIKIEITKNQIKMQVCDEGEGIKCDKNRYNPLDFKECGRGIVLVKGLSDEFKIEGTKAISIKYINP
ncbi:ATP-binding protein [Clostridiaceae bacterium M8S5]|nr:ATP-binding protein [Clostridiaceae bacterium M8S5]